ncbi:MAG: anhydro-N-acetylmuramic acid kinase [Hydrogenibacillus sp.]|nr:anhydro-N-acetylmuramic acid kinase [Hydrogenibacillus sp.]
MAWYLPLAEKHVKVAVGLMSGTSLDGVDAAVVRLRGAGLETSVELLGFFSVPYDASLRARLLAASDPETSRVDEIAVLSVRLAELYADVAKEAAQAAGVPWSAVDFISSHGQTIHHLPEAGATLQIGELAVLAERAQKVVVGDFRPHDLAVGGQGAPLVPYADYVLFRDATRGRVLLNIGGIANVTVVGAGARPEDVLAFDTGPGNMIIDAFVQLGTDGTATYDRDGAFARAGTVDAAWLRALLEHPYYRLPPPKSTGREQFGRRYAEMLWAEGDRRGVSFEDRVATVTALTVETIAGALRTHVFGQTRVDELIVSGGGARNGALLEGLRAALPELAVDRSDRYGIPAEAKEAVAFALLGNEAIHRMPNQLPSATGARKRAVMGKVVLPS